jgi:predicted TIM-barrel enzyme
MEDEEALEASALVSQLTDAVKHQVNDFLANGVVATGIVVGSIFLSSDQLLWVEKLTVSAGTNLINYSRLEVDKDGSWNVLPGSGFAEERIEGVVSTANGFVAGHLTIRLDTVLQAVQLPAGISHLHTSLTDMDRDAFTHIDWFL